MKKIVLMLASNLLLAGIALADHGGGDKERMYLNDKMLYGEQFQRDGSYPVDYGYPRDQSVYYQNYQGYPTDQSSGYYPNQNQGAGYNYSPSNQGYYYWNQDTRPKDSRSLKDSGDGFPRYPGPQGPTKRNFGFYTYNRPEAYQYQQPQQQYGTTTQPYWAVQEQQYAASAQQQYAASAQQQYAASAQQQYAAPSQQQSSGFASFQPQTSYSSYPEPFRAPQPSGSNSQQIADADNYVTPVNPPAQSSPLSAPSDGQLMNQVRMSLVNAGSGYNDISVNVVNGIVKLDGVVATDQERKDIEIQIYKVPGVKNIQDNIQLRGSSY